jgi:DNA-binding winged helix-turn-helix (wHTH) protein
MNRGESVCPGMHRVVNCVYVFTGFRLDAACRQLSTSGGVVVRLNSRAMEALLLLLANAGEVVDRRRLMTAVWPAAVVEDNNLNQCILAIRRALGEVAGSNQYIMTVPGRGFCFVSPVHTMQRDTPAEPARVESTALVVHMRQAASSAVAVTGEVLGTCVVDHPDLQLQIEIRLVRPR